MTANAPRNEFLKANGCAQKLIENRRASCEPRSMHTQTKNKKNLPNKVN